MDGLIFRKLGMVTTYDAEGVAVPATLLYNDGNTVLQKKTEEKEGYRAAVLGFGEAKEKNKSKSFVGVCKKAKTNVKEIFREIRDFSIAAEAGKVIKTPEVFAVGDKVHAHGISKGKGFQGVVKKHDFSGVGSATHGQHNRERHPGSLGASSFPERVFPGMRMAGRMGHCNVTVRNLEVLEIDSENDLIVVKGSVPGVKNSFVVLVK